MSCYIIALLNVYTPFSIEIHSEMNILCMFVDLYVYNFCEKETFTVSLFADDFFFRSAVECQNIWWMDAIRQTPIAAETLFPYLIQSYTTVMDAVGKKKRHQTCLELG